MLQRNETKKEKEKWKRKMKRRKLELLRAKHRLDKGVYAICDKAIIFEQELCCAYASLPIYKRNMSFPIENKTIEMINVCRHSSSKIDQTKAQKKTNFRYSERNRSFFCVYFMYWIVVTHTHTHIIDYNWQIDFPIQSIRTRFSVKQRMSNEQILHWFVVPFEITKKIEKCFCSVAIVRAFITS